MAYGQCDVNLNALFHDVQEPVMAGAEALMS
jgi:hypothetical protein